MQPKKHSATIHDVARAASVSVSTVSRVLNGKTDVASDTQERVLNVIAELNYTSNLAARSMRSRSTHVIGLIIPDVATPYAVQILYGVNHAIARSNYDLIVYTNGNNHKNNTAEHERQYVSLLNGSITDGVIVVTPTATNFATDAPVVIIDPNNESPGLPAVIATNQAGALSVMTYLTGLGHRRIGFITGRLEMVSANQRLQGYKDGLAACGIAFDEKLVEVADYSTETALGCARSLLALDAPPTAIFASNDMSATAVYQAAQELGVRIPEELSVVGFDNIRESVYLNPPLTTVDQFLTDMGTVAVEMIVNLIKGEILDNDPHKIQTQLVVRDSCLPLGIG
jgi:LacI family transcriptional regulator